MLFVALLEVSGGTPMERIARRADWQYPAGIKQVISIFEADDIAPIFAITAQWGDVFNIKVVPAVTGEQGLKLAQQMMQG